MKNLNTDVTFFSEAEMISPSHSGTVNIYGACKETPIVSAIKSSEDGVLKIASLKFLLSINALERLREPIHFDDETKENSIYFREHYHIRLRLTEPSSGQFVDLFTEEFCPYTSKVSLCRDIFTKKEFFHFQNISVAVPKKENYCVLKVLVHHSSNSEWIVQSIHPIKLEINE